MKCLIIGADGFVGYHLYNHIAKINVYKNIYRTFYNTDLLPLHNSENCFLLDITDLNNVRKILAEIRPNFIYHLAAQSSVAVSWKEPQLTFKINTIGFLNILEAVKELEIKPRILVIGSSEEYGCVKETDNPINEEKQVNPLNPYAVSKYTQFLLSDVYRNAYNLEIIKVRAFNHIGPGQNENFVVSDFCKKIAMIEKGKSENLLKVGNLDAIRDFTDVRDIVNAYYLLMKNGLNGELYNVGSNNPIKIKIILEILLNLSIKNINVEIDESKFRPIDVPIIQCDNTKLKKHTGWINKIEIKETLKEVLEYWRTLV